MLRKRKRMETVEKEEENGKCGGKKRECRQLGEKQQHRGKNDIEAR